MTRSENNQGNDSLSSEVIIRKGRIEDLEKVVVFNSAMAKVAFAASSLIGSADLAIASLQPLVDPVRLRSAGAPPAGAVQGAVQSRAGGGTGCRRCGSPAIR
ncbi:hypothetical protein Vafri_18814 [Volvox africanus]|uniref:Uncharacterized protein n=1 Tax=Volvox africanus TaxID=51714 RepID=A0A8J4BMQ6_9CHLO|nr:hypothetical protein Vafri_18814 [Volvox africanus]